MAKGNAGYQTGIAWHSHPALHTNNDNEHSHYVCGT